MPSLLPAFVVLSSASVSFSLLILILNTNLYLCLYGHNSLLHDPIHMVGLSISSIVAQNLTNMLNAGGDDNVGIGIDVGVDVDVGD